MIFIDFYIKIIFYNYKMLNNFINFIVALDNKYGIGIDNTIPWHLKDDLKQFKNLTENNIVIMGNNTYNSIPDKYRPLSNRLNLVLTNNKSLLENNHEINNLYYFNFKYEEDKLVKIGNIIQGFQEYKNSKIFIAGGQEIYNLFYNLLLNNKEYHYLIQNFYITSIEKNFKCNKFFVNLSEAFYINNYTKIYHDKENSLNYRFITYKFNPNYIDNYEKNYLDIAKQILNTNNYKHDRTNTGILSIFGTQMRFDISSFIPMLTTKRVPFKTCIEELLWFLKGKTDNKILQEKKVHIWDGNSSREYLDKIGLENLEEGDCGACYGFQWRHFGAEYKDCNTNYNKCGIDQVEYVLSMLQFDPYSRRIFMSAWNPKDLYKTCLPPCHVSIQFYVTKINNKKYLSGHMYQRSADWFLGEPFNILSYTALIYLFATMCDMIPHELIISTGDTHIYSNHIEQMKEQLNRNPLSKPKLYINPEVRDKNIDDITIEDFELIGYNSHPTIKGKMAV